MPKITEREYKACYEISKKVQKKEMTSEHAIEYLIHEYGINQSSAIIIINFFQKIMRGENPKRTISEAHMRYYLQRIMEDYGNTQLEKALSAINIHIEYYENMSLSNKRFGIRKLHNEFSQRIGISPIFELNSPYSRSKGKAIDLLIKNAFDFLEIAIEQLKKDDSKYSVISFCTAVELFFKARLMDEHWSLVVDISGRGKDHPNLNNFKSGNFKSINFNELLSRIKNVSNEHFSQEFENCFKILSGHRNRVVHFYYESDNADEKEKIALEQFIGWGLLRQRLLGEWKGIFNNYSNKIEHIDKKMQKYKNYWKAAFERMKSDIKKKEKEGIIFRDCLHCRTKANQEKIITNFIREYECLVCQAYDHCIMVKCSECKGNIEIFQEYDQVDIIQCQNCGEEMDREDISNILDSDKPMSNKEYMYYLRNNCGECLTSESVIRHEDYYICLNCFYLTKNIMQCDWCVEEQIGGDISDNTYWSGCNFCFGREGDGFGDD